MYIYYIIAFDWVIWNLRTSTSFSVNQFQSCLWEVRDFQWELCRINTSKVSVSQYLPFYYIFHLVGKEYVALWALNVVENLGVLLSLIICKNVAEECTDMNKR